MTSSSRRFKCLFDNRRSSRIDRIKGMIMVAKQKGETVGVVVVVKVLLCWCGGVGVSRREQNTTETQNMCDVCSLEPSPPKSFLALWVYSIVQLYVTMIK